MNTLENIRMWKTRIAQLSCLLHNFSSNAARATAFEQMGLGNARTFYRCARMFKLTSKEACKSATAALEAVEETLKP
jgi:hypothetical protein